MNPNPGLPDGIAPEALISRATQVLDQTVQALPGPIRAEVGKLTILLDVFPPEEDAENLGFYHGFTPGEVADSEKCVQLFVGSICNYCEEEGLDFEEEVRLTFLHELGHHLGLDEDDIEMRGLL